jgi:flagellar protein FliS
MLVQHGYPAAAYRQISVDTAPPGKLVIMLYRRAILACRQAADAIEQKKIEKAHNELVRAQEIVLELELALTRSEGPLADTLVPLYVYFRDQLVASNLHKDTGPARHVADLMESLLEAWETVLQGGSSSQPVTVQNVVSLEQSG